MKINNLSVFFPAYNEEANISETVKKAAAVLDGLALKDYEIIVVSDGSTDKTVQIVKDLTLQNPHIRLVDRPVNGGYGEALRSGFYSARYDYIVYTDSDGQFNFSEVTKFIEKLDRADVVVGFRVNRSDNAVRVAMGWLWTFLSNIILGVGVKDVDCAFKLVKKKVIETIPKLQSTRGGMISPELLALSKKYGFKIAEVGVRHYPRQAGRQTGADLQVMLNSFADLFRLWWELK